MRARLAIALLAFSAAVPAQQLGTLFLSPRERELLDRQRRGEKVEAEGQVAIQRPDPVITGYVKRSDGKSTVFVDRQPVPVRNPRLERRLEPRAVERYDPMPMPVDPGGEAKAGVTKAAADRANEPASAPPRPGKDD